MRARYLHQLELWEKREVMATTRFDSSQNLAETITRVKVYNQHIPQRALGHLIII